MSGGYPHTTIILQIYLYLSNQLIQYHQEAKKHILGLNFGNISIEAFALTINARKDFFLTICNLKLFTSFIIPPFTFSNCSFDGFKSFSTFQLGAMQAL